MFHASRIGAQTGAYYRTLTATLLRHNPGTLGAAAGALGAAGQIEWVL